MRRIRKPGWIACCSVVDTEGPRLTASEIHGGCCRPLQGHPVGWSSGFTSIVIRSTTGLYLVGCRGAAGRLLQARFQPWKLRQISRSASGCANGGPPPSPSLECARKSCNGLIQRESQRNSKKPARPRSDCLGIGRPPDWWSSSTCFTGDTTCEKAAPGRHRADHR